MPVRITSKTSKRNRKEIVKEVLDKVPTQPGGKKSELKELGDRIIETAEIPDDELVASVRKPSKDGKAGRPKGQTDADYQDKLVAVYRLRCRGLTVRQCADQLNMGVGPTHELITKMEEQLRIDVKKLDVAAYIGDTLAFYRELRGMAMLMTSNAKATAGQRLYAMRIALSVQDSTNNFLEQVGVYGPAVSDQVAKIIATLPGSIVAKGEQKASAGDVLVHELGRMFLNHGIAKMAEGAVVVDV